MPLDPATEQLAERIADRVDAIQRSRPPPSPWLNTSQAAAYLGLSIKTLQTYRLDNGGEPGPDFVSKGLRVRRYHVDSLNEWLASGAGE